MVIGFAWGLAIGRLAISHLVFLSRRTDMFAPSTSRQSFSRNKAEVIFRRLIIGIALIYNWNIEYAWADSLESALMPGQAIQGHAK